VKNLAPATVTLFLSLLIALSTAIVNFFFDTDWLQALITFGVTFGISYLLIYYSLQVFIFRKIKLIYKSIHNLKLGKDDTGVFKDHLSDNPVDDVEKEVEDWAITKRREIERLKEMEKFRREFLANVSHELKTPLFTLQGYIHTLLEGAIDDPEVNKKFLEKSANSLERLCGLVDDLDEISMVEKGEMSLVPDVFDINKLAKEVFDAIEIKAERRKIQLSIKKGCDRPFYVFADKERIRQVLTNLIDNSVKYGREGGETVVGFYDMDENILTEVTDNGIGIDEANLPRLFERFYRVDKHRSREAGGSGLGLAIVKHLVEAHKGTLNVRSTPGIGTTFGFTLRKSKEK
jgi:two-component system, OmpR family, phosphate regulon sensor histidine kinase PhoR